MKLNPKIFLIIGLFISAISLAQVKPTRNNATVSDSLLKKYRKCNPILYSLKGDLAISNFLFYKKGKHWKGIMFNDVSLVDRNSQFVHVIFIKNFDADTIGPKLIRLGVKELKQYTQTELSDFYNKKMQEKTNNTKLDYSIPSCSSSGLVSIFFQDQTTSYPNCLCSIEELKALPEIKHFADIFNYLQGTVFQILNKRKK